MYCMFECIVLYVRVLLFRKEALSTEHLEQQRKIAKEKLKLEAMRKKVITIEIYHSILYVSNIV